MGSTQWSFSAPERGVPPRSSASRARLPADGRRLTPPYSPTITCAMTILAISATGYTAA